MKNFVGHLIYPYSIELEEYFFTTEVYVSENIVYFNGEEVTRGLVPLKLRHELVKKGYTFVKERVLKLNRSKPKIKYITCKKLDCPYRKGRSHKYCKGDFKVSFDKTYITRRGERKIIDHNIMLSYPTEDLRELLLLTDCIYRQVLFDTGIKGKEDPYAKMELC